jgi:hypothetical protein
MHNHAQLIRLAMMMNLTPRQAVALPTVFAIAARKTGYKQEQICHLCEINQDAREIVKRSIVEAMQECNIAP